MSSPACKASHCSPSPAGGGLSCSTDASRSDALRCLWIGRYIPYPIGEGAKLYTAKLAASLAHAGALVRGLGFGGAHSVPLSKNIEWLSVSGARSSHLRSLVSRWPLAAAVDATRAYRSLLEEQLREDWDVIVIDSYGAGWALERCQRYRDSRSTTTVLVHVSHNHEAAVWKAMVDHSQAGAARRWLLKRNSRKVRALEQQIVNGVDLLTTITSEDQQSLGGPLPASRKLALTPGYDGPMTAVRAITANTPRRAVIVGSFGWVVKQENLCRFLEYADPVFARHGIELFIAGEVPADLQASLRTRCQATRFEGFVADLAPLMAQTRIAIVPELIGGGFKLKLLDYIFARVPVATIATAAAGLPGELQKQLLAGSDFKSLVETIVAHIDNVDELNRRQESAFARAQVLFHWEDRGAQLLERIAEVRRGAARRQPIEIAAAMPIPVVKPTPNGGEGNSLR